jgi:PadR family transcriptional regulator PadR
MEDTRWPGDWLRSALGLCVLAVLADGPTYGYAIILRLAEAGLGAVKGGTLYPLLARLEQDGLVASSWQAGDAGPGRKYFTLTDTGRSELTGRSREWGRFVGVTRRLLPTTQEIP